MSNLNRCENGEVNKNTPLPTCTPLPSQHEELTVDSIQITYDISDKRNEYYFHKDEKKWAKFLQTVLFSITILLFGLQMSTPSAFSCYNFHVSLNQTNGGCAVQFSQFIVVLVIVATQMVVMIPLNVHPVLLVLVRLLHICALLYIKFEVHRYLMFGRESHINFGYIGFMLLCGCVIAALVTEMPGKLKRQRKFYISILSVLTAIAIVLEIGLNTRQIILLNDVLIAFGSIVVPYIFVALLFYFLKIWKHHAENYRPVFFASLAGSLILAYLTLPTLHFTNVGMEISLYIISLVGYYSIFATYQYCRFH